MTPTARHNTKLAQFSLPAPTGAPTGAVKSDAQSPERRGQRGIERRCRDKQELAPSITETKCIVILFLAVLPNFLFLFCFLD